MEHIQRNQNRMETGVPIEKDFPCGAYYKNISGYRDGEVLSHWHIEFEAILVVEGEMDYVGEASEYTISKGEGIFINSNVLHSFKKKENKECRYLVVIFHPSLIGMHEEGRIYKVYFAPFIAGNRKFLDLRVERMMVWREKWMFTMLEIEKSFGKKKEGYELEIQRLLLGCWEQLYKSVIKDCPVQQEKREMAERVYQAMRYIKEHIDEKIYLSDVAKSCTISNTECCRMFKRQVGQSPMGYIMKYRIKQSLELLENENLTVREVGEMVGFESHSYYTKNFRKVMKCSPKEYRASI